MARRIDETPVRRNSVNVTEPSPGTPTGPVKPGNTGILAELGKIPTWLMNALAVKTPQATRVLDTAKIAQAIDLYQSGWPFARMFGIQLSTPIQQPAGKFLLVGLAAGGFSGLAASLAPVNSVWNGFGGTPPNGAGEGGEGLGPAIPQPAGGFRGIDPSLTYRIMALAITHNGGAGAGVVDIFAAPSRGVIITGAGNPALASVSIAQNGGIAVFMAIGGAPANRVALGFTVPQWLPASQVASLDWLLSFPATAALENYQVDIMLMGVPAGSQPLG